MRFRWLRFVGFGFLLISFGSLVYVLFHLGAVPKRLPLRKESIVAVQCLLNVVLGSLFGVGVLWLHRWINRGN